MSGNGIVDRYLPKQPAEPGGFEPLPVHAPMIDLHLDDGSRVALPYAGLVRATLVADRAITLHFPADEIVIQGEGLEPLYRGIAQHRIGQVKPRGDARGFGGSGGEPVVARVVRATEDG